MTRCAGRRRMRQRLRWFDMTDMVAQFVLPLLGAAGGGITAYAAIRSDLAALRATVEILAKSLERAHERIDDMKDRR